MNRVPVRVQTRFDFCEVARIVATAMDRESEKKRALLSFISPLVMAFKRLKRKIDRSGSVTAKGRRLRKAVARAASE